MDQGGSRMRVGDLYRVVVPLGAHPFNDYLHGMIVVILGDPIKSTGIPNEYVKGLGDKVRMFSVRWLEAL